MNHTIGVAAVLFDDAGCVLLQQRTKHPGHGYLVLPGGKLDELDPIIGMRRELTEELGIKDLHMPPLHSFTFAHDNSQNFPVMMLYYRGMIHPSKVLNAEPEKCSGLVWQDPNKLPSNMWDNDVIAILKAMQLYGMRTHG